MQEALVASTIKYSYFIHVIANLKGLKKIIDANFIASTFDDVIEGMQDNNGAEFAIYVYSSSSCIF